MSNEAESGVLKQKATAFGGGLGWANYTLCRKLAPRISDIMTTFRDASTLLPLPQEERMLEHTAEPGKGVAQ
jgi:hypothetical protein